jgi:hypothetical protein
MVTAAHEAGHCVASILLGYTVDSVTIKPNVDNFSYGQCATRNIYEMSERDYGTFLAGADVAVHLLLGVGFENHRRNIPHDYDAATVRARTLLGTPEAREQVRSLAERLLMEETVTFKEPL